MVSRRHESSLALCAVLLLLGTVCAAQQPATTADAGVSIVGTRRYLRFCAGCHGADGKGGDKAASLATSQSIMNRSDAELFRIVHDGTADGMPPFAQIGDANIVAVIHYLRILEADAAPAGAPESTAAAGDAGAGRALFFGKARCSSCHMVQGSGGFIASNLTTWARGRSADTILGAITTPDTPLVPTSRVISVTTKAGQSLTGVLRNEDNFNLELETEDGHYHLLARNNLTEVHYTDRSLMPRDYATRLTQQELNDVVSFLIASSRNQHRDAEPLQ
jgi:putative heme-binding domain-containing protein